jgi:hypothetical protein
MADPFLIVVDELFAQRMSLLDFGLEQLRA